MADSSRRTRWRGPVLLALGAAYALIAAATAPFTWPANILTAVPIVAMVVAAVCCLGIPYGTVLGVFTLIVLSRRSVSSLFEPQPTAALAGGG